ncbi:MAG: glycosyltransferase [Candidatus Rokubacteria bacterium]|nr:glycosyltransferase [Candidatus Rokubacteria bacterium]
MRVAVLSVHTCPLAALGGKETGGMNVYVREVARELARMGVAVDVFTRSQNPDIPRVVELAPGARVVHLAAGPETPMPRERVWAHVDEFADRVDAWRLTQGGGDYDAVHAHYWLSGVVGLELRARWGVPVVQMFHTLARLKNDAAREPGDREPLLRVAEETRVAAEVDRIVAASEIERAQLVGLYGARFDRISVVPCGVDTELFRPGDTRAARARLGLDDRPTLVYVGRIAPIKGLATLLEAVDRLGAAGRPVRLLVIGGDADDRVDGHEAYVRGLTCRLGLCDDVRFLGAQPQAALRDYYVAADLTIMPSYYESFGMVALEAMACGSPVVASRVGGLATTVRDGFTGFLVPEGDPVALAGRIDALLTDAPLRAKLGAEGTRWAARHRWACVADAVCREYARVQPRAGRVLASTRCR